jgi:thioredoxin 2
MREAIEIVICPHCSAGNRVPRERLDSAPNCGKCHLNLFTGSSVAVNAKSLFAHTTKGTLPVLVDFWAPWCGPCKMMAPAFEQAAQALEPYVRLLKVNTEEEQALASTYAIRSIPTLIMLTGGKELKRMSGALDARGIVQFAKG